MVVVVTEVCVVVEFRTPDDMLDGTPDDDARTGATVPDIDWTGATLPDIDWTGATLPDIDCCTGATAADDMAAGAMLREPDWAATAERAARARVKNCMMLVYMCLCVDKRVKTSVSVVLV